jgi:hypothetical protein
MPMVNGIYTAAGVHLDGVWDDDGSVTPDPDPRTCEYIHFDLSTEQLGRTGRYNCWGFTFLPRRYWIGRIDVDNIIRDNCDPVPDGSVRVGDVIRYRIWDETEERLVTTHTGRVWQTDSTGHATLIRSKWGPSAEYIHPPLGGTPPVPSIYGTNLAYFRQKAPLRGRTDETGKIADLWIKDSPGDNGEQYSGAPWWTSPDILVDVPPYDDNPDLNPVFDHPNRVWAVVHNRVNQRIEGVYVRYYWADPAAGLAPSNWHLIPSTPGHPNPAGPINIDGNSSTAAPYVEWTPTTAPAHQCLLAIAYINDDPQDSNNPDPLVYPFEITWDNNIAQRNVHVMELNQGSNGECSIEVGVPFDGDRKDVGFIQAVLTYSPRLPIVGYPKRIVPLEVILVLDRERELLLEPWRDHLQEEAPFKPEDPCLREKPVAGTAPHKLVFVPKRRYRLDVKIGVPKEAKVGSVYYLHIAQSISNTVTGGYTVAIVVV